MDAFRSAARRPALVRIGAGLIFAGLVICAAVPELCAGDWPQILGPHRDGKADGERLEPWSGAAPPTVWQREVGRGFAGAAIVGARAVVFHRDDDELLIEALDLASGKTQWKSTLETHYRSSISSDDGPRCVPLVHQGRVYVCGPSGELACLALDTGKRLWARQVYQEFSAPDGYFGAGSSPIVEGDKLLLNVGGKRKAGLVAFALKDGKTIWTATDEAASYSSPMAATIDGVRHVVFVTRLSVVSVDPQNGDVRFRFPFGDRGPTVNAANPLLLGDHVFVSSSYGIGARWAKITPREARQEWESDSVMSSQYTTCVEKDGLLYGIDGRQDVGVARLRCFDPRTRDVKWTEEGFGTGSLILAGDKLLIMKTDGELVLAEPSPEKFRPLAQAQLFRDTVQALPALSTGLLLIRDTQTLKCVRVGK